MKKQLSLLSLTSITASLLLPGLVLASGYTLNNPLGSASSPSEVVANIIAFVIGLIGIIALVMFIYGGFVILTAHGNADQFKKGTHTLVYAILGMVVVLTSYSVLSYIFTNIFNFSNS